MNSGFSPPFIDLNSSAVPGTFIDQICLNIFLFSSSDSNKILGSEETQLSPQPFAVSSLLIFAHFSVILLQERKTQR